MKDITKYAPWLLLLSGIILFIPKLYNLMNNLTGETPYIQIIIGAIAIIIALISFKK